MERLILCGGGHVSLEVAYMASHLEFEVVVIDDREEFANPERFPMAAQVLCKPFLEALDELGSRSDDYYVILTRGHAFDGECLAKVLQGVGLQIGAQTPAEIAVSILGEVIQERARKGPGTPPPPSEKGVLCTITRKSGSAPRGEGTWMLVHPDGTCVGTIGGGAVEYRAKLDALEMMKNGVEREHKLYDLSHAAAELGMVCGGKIEVDFENRKG